MSLDEMNLELDLTPAELAGVFTAKGWQIHGTQDTYPLPEELSANISKLSARLLGDALSDWVTLGRVVVYRDSDFPGSVEIALTIGRAMPILPPGADCPDTTDGGFAHA